jgi:predicted MPP superfamily phosphohydrolase
MSIFTIVLLVFAATQFYWAWRAYSLAARIFPARPARLAVCGAVLALYLFVLAFNFGWFGPRGDAVYLTWSDALLAAPFRYWLACSIISFVVAALFAIPQGLVAAVRKLASKKEIASPPRRQFLERTAQVATAAPFVAGAYGLLYGRLNLETTTQRIRLAKLPKQFEGFRICQLSDIHIGPFMPAEEIRKYAAIANQLKPDLMVLTGDFVTFDPATQQAVVEALSSLRAPYGVDGCLGNHDAWAGVEDSITALFQQTGVRILRGENVPIAAHGEALNLIGVDFQSQRRFGPSPPVAHILRNIESFVARDRVNILLSHNPDTFDRAAELGIDLSMAGHTHGGQAALEFISPEIAPTRLVTPYVAGLFQKQGGQLYVNRGIGTIFIPIRIGAPPEITVYELAG